MIKYFILNLFLFTACGILPSQKGYCTMFLIALLIAIFVSVYFSYRQLKKKSQLLKNKDKAIKKMEQDIENVKEVVKSSEISRAEIFRVYTLMVRLSVSSKRDRYQKFLLDYNSFIHNNSEEFRFEWEEFRVLLNSICNSYIDELESLYPTLSEKEIQVIAMQKAGFDIPDIATISGYSINTIYKRNSDIRRKLGVPELGNIIHFIDHKTAKKTDYTE